MRTLVPKSEGSIALVTAMLGGLLLMACSGAPASAAAATTPSSKGKSKSQTLPPAYVEHKVTRGETLWRIAQKHKTSVGSIMDYNRMSDQMVREGMTLRIPTPRPRDPKTQREHLHVVKGRETFWSIADEYGVSPKALAQANPNVNPNRLHEDMELVIPVEERTEASAPGASSGNAPSSLPAPTQPGMMAHKVEDNETYYSIAKRYGVTMDAMVTANPQVKPERLRPGMTVQVPMKTTRPPANTDPVPANSGGSSVASGPNQRTYKIRSGDTMASIAQKHGVSEAALLKENKLSENDPFYVDDVLKIPAGQSAPRANSGNKTVVQPGEKPGTSPQPPKQQTKGKEGSIPSYIVSAGEDIATICDAFGISRQQLLEYNRLPANARLKTGDEIMIPRSGGR